MLHHCRYYVVRSFSVCEIFSCFMSFSAQFCARLNVEYKKNTLLLLSSTSCSFFGDFLVLCYWTVRCRSWFLASVYRNISEYIHKYSVCAWMRHTETNGAIKKPNWNKHAKSHHFDEICMAEAEKECVRVRERVCLAWCEMLIACFYHFYYTFHTLSCLFRTLWCRVASLVLFFSFSFWVI